MREQLLAVWGLLVRDRDADWGPPVPLLPGPRAVRLAVALVSTVPLTWMLALTWGEAVNPMAGGLLVLAHLLPWVLSHRRPLTAWRLVLAVLVLLAVLPLVVDLPRVLPGAPPVERPWSVGALALVPPLFAAAARAPRDRRVPLTACTVAAVALASALPAAGLPDSPIPVFLAAAVLVLAFSRARERSTASELAWVSTAMAAEQAKTAVLAERSRIARELHDVIAHHLSMIAVRTDSAPYRLSISDAAVRTELAELGAAARQALHETRGLLGVLREESTAPERAPQPTLADLPALVAESTAAGARVSLLVEGTPGPLGAAAQLAVYRVVQEALSNARRHSPGAPVQVWLRHLGDVLHLVVENDPGTAPPAGSGPGNGLTGMRERVTVVGGTFTAQARQDGGYAVRATIPVRGEGAT